MAESREGGEPLTPSLPLVGRGGKEFRRVIDDCDFCLRHTPTINPTTKITAWNDHRIGLARAEIPQRLHELHFQPVAALLLKLFEGGFQPTLVGGPLPRPIADDL